LTRPKAIVITGCDRNHFALAEDLAASLRAVHGGEVDFGFIRFCDTPLPAPIAAAADHVFDCSADYAAFRKEHGFYVASTGIKAKLPDAFPGYDIYCWIDADCWIQDRATVEKMIASAMQFEICIHPEYDVHYRYHPTPGDRSKLIYARVYPQTPLDAQSLNLPMLNAGVYAMRAGAGLWRRWADEMADMKRRFAAGEATFLCDQIPLHKIIYGERIRYFPLRATDNWQLYACRPNLDRQRRLLTVPTPPYEPIGVLHLAGATKDMEMAKDAAGEKVTYRYRDVMRLFGEAG
jgi:hypothetical protein